MVCFNRFFRRCLVGFFGLVLAPFAFAGDIADAYNACMAGVTYVETQQAANAYGCCKAPDSVRWVARCEYYIKPAGNPSGTPERAGFLVRGGLYTTAGAIQGYMPPGFVPNPPAGIVRDLITVDGYQNWFYRGDEGQYCGTRPSPGTVACPSAGTTQQCVAGCTMYITNTSGTCSGSWTLPNSTDYYGQICSGGSGSSSSTDYDGDGIPNGTDVCPYEAGTGCPAGDTDGDGTANGQDPCPADATNACPEGDSDGDGATNGDDPCPSDPGNSCPGTNNPPGGGDPGGSAGGGFGCDEAPSCSADAVDCAMLWQQWQTRCNTMKTDSKIGEIKDLLGGSFEPGDLPSEEEGTASLAGLSKSVELDSSSISEAGLGLPRTCPTFSDVNFTISGHAMSLPLSHLSGFCDILGWVGTLIVAFASFWAVRILIVGY